MLRALRLTVLAAAGGAATGAVVFAFLRSLDHVTDLRLDHPWLVWLLPLVGLIVAGSYHRWGGRAKGGTTAVIEQANVFTHGAPARMAPLIFGGAVAGHLVGASVGREGAALQIAGSVTDTGGRLLRLSERDRRLLLAASLAGGWGAAFGVPLTGVVFTFQFARHHRWRTVPFSLVSAYSGRAVVHALGYPLDVTPPLPDVDWSVGLLVALIVGGLVFGLLARLFVRGLHSVKRRSAHLVGTPALRGFIGGAAVLALIAVFGRSYLGLSLPLLAESLDPATAGDPFGWARPVLKLLFTVVSLGTGFVGGDVAPLFVIGGTAGAAVASTLGCEVADRVVLAAIGSSVTYAAAASVTFTGIVLAVEQFGWNAFVPALVASVSTRIAAGRPGLYEAEHHTRR
jgi:H+/Cl- antiporter ClcA